MSKLSSGADAKSTLGFGNRSPSHATRYAEGCAYLLLRVEPGNLTGTKVHDPADVEQWLSRYVKRGEPPWDVDYVGLRGEFVMFITIL